MSDARWSDVGTACQSAVLHFRNSLELYGRGGFDAPGLEGYMASMAMMHAMQAGHTSAEAALKRILDILGEERPTGEDWHETLILRLARPMEGSRERPAVLSRETAAALQETRRFRHIAAHGYDRFDPGLAAPSIRAARHIADEMEAEIKRFREIVDPERG